MIDPRGMTIADWSSSLQIDFPADNVPILLSVQDGQNWQRWANRILECPSFSDNDIPKPDEFSAWSEWAIRVYQYMG